MPVAGIDHVALPTADGERFLEFYKRLGFTSTDEAEWRAGRYPIFSIACGNNKLNVHPPGFVATLRGPNAVPGCGDVCFVWDGRLAALHEMLARAGVAPIAGPVDRIGGRAGGTASGVSVYLRDPDDNLVEFICYDETPVGRVS
jgi:catechol 2,3-dioxygenase-like lactoylglutathione lyase family enzyme